MKILITGATGFVGKHLVPELLRRGHALRCVSRAEKQARLMPWYHDVEFVIQDINTDLALHDLFNDVETLIHLSWTDLANYKSIIHIETHLPDHIRFLRSAVEAGVKQILASGTCLEYGMKNGELSEVDDVDPQVPYAIAKDSLRRYLQALQKEFTFELKWVRLFYLYGRYQSERSLLSQLEAAIENDENVFNMSQGDQLRDFISIEKATAYMVDILENSHFDGVVNCCSGSPTSVRSFVEKRMSALNASIKLNLGFYPYPDYEPMAFWGSNEKLNEVINVTNVSHKKGKPKKGKP